MKMHFLRAGCEPDVYAKVWSVCTSYLKRYFVTTDPARVTCGLCRRIMKSVKTRKR
jgi:hypothetical protein